MNKSKHAKLREYYYKHAASIGGDYISFRRKVLDRQRYDYEYKGKTELQAARKLLHSLEYVSKSDIGRENIIAGMKQFGIYQEFLDLVYARSESGRFISPKSLLAWDKTLKAWTFMGKDESQYAIVTYNSPVSMLIAKI